MTSFVFIGTTLYMGNCCGFLGEMKNLIPWEYHCIPPLGFSWPRRNSIYHLRSNRTVTVLLSVGSVGRLGRAQNGSEALKLGGSPAGRGAQPSVCVQEQTQCFVWRIISHLGASGPFFIKAKGLKVWLRQSLSALAAVV